jgi:hypothetical protein
MPRFVILTHDWPFPHWDLLLEQGETLACWRLLAEPGRGRTVPAQRLADHRRLYLDYEGPVSGDRGEVRRWDWGEFGFLAQTPGQEEVLTVQLRGEKLAGPVAIRAGREGDCGVQF